MDNTIAITGIRGAKIVTDGVKTLIWEHKKPFYRVMALYQPNGHSKIIFFLHKINTSFLQW